ncbi:hypothetical protein ABPG72_018171 [Tetrahymena utriculariae]
MGRQGENILLYQFMFLKGMAIIYLAAFLSIFYQINALLGYDGLLPVHTYLKRLRNNGINKDMSNVPTIVWWAPEIMEYIEKAIPSLSEFDSYETLLHLICLVGVLLSILVLLSNKFMNFLVYLTLWFLYLSIFSVGQLFFSFQWDIMLLEAGFLTVFITPTTRNGQLIVDEISSVTRDLLKWLCFRLNYASGVVKLTSKCPTWWSLTALHYHFESQPLPNPISYYFHQLPSWLKKLFVAQNFVTLIGGSLLIYSPFRRFRQFGGLMLLSEQFMIILTGNYNFFNFLTVLVTLATFDDKFLKFWTPKFILSLLGDYNSCISKPQKKESKSKNKDKYKDPYSPIIKILKLLIYTLIFIGMIIYAYLRYFPLEAIFENGKVNFTLSDVRVDLINGKIPVVALVASMLFCVHNLFCYSLKYNSQKSLIVNTKRLFAITFGFIMYMLTSYTFFAGLDKEMFQFPLNIPLLAQLQQHSQPFHIANSYGLFRVMTGINGREELTFEVSEDGVNYQELTLFYKPGPIDQPLKFVAPYHPRFDWQLWFSAMKPHINEAYLLNFMFKLINNKPSALSLVDHNPLKGKEINYMLIKKYTYSYTTLEERAVTGNVWNRKNPQVMIEKVMRVDNNLEKNLRLMHQEIDTKRYPIHILRQTVPLIEIVWTLLVLIIIKNFLNNRKQKV